MRFARERQERQAHAELVEGSEVHELTVEREDSFRAVTVRLHAAHLTPGQQGDVSAFLGADGEIYVYEEDSQRLHAGVDVDDLADWLSRDETAYIDAMNALGRDPTIDVGRAVS